MPVELSHRYSRLLTLCRYVSDGRSWWVCSCLCGTPFVVARSDRLLDGSIKSCGCGRATRGLMSKSPTYISWAAMRRRCNDPTHPRYSDYGGRGIFVCREWDDAEKGFERFVSDMGLRPPGKTLDRKNVDLSYNPKNCRWATLIEQRWNRRDMRKDVQQELMAEAAYWNERERETERGERREVSDG